MKIRKTMTAIAALALATQPVYAAKKSEKGPSRYLQCDGQPNNTTAGETAARLLGAITLLAIFAPSPETPDPKARKFGEEGVKICTSLLEGTEDVEGNPIRRMELMMGRAIHYIEAKNYAAAIADIEQVEKEATSNGFMDDPYFSRSFARSFPQIKAAALVRMGKYDEAQQLLDASFAQTRYAVWPTLTAAQNTNLRREATEAEASIFDMKARIFPPLLHSKAERLEELGDFEKAAQSRKSAILRNEIYSSEFVSTLPIANAAVTHALAGKWDAAAKFAADANASLETRKTAGKNEKNLGEIVEVMDLYQILKLANDGDLKTARRNFAARSKWVAPSFGAIMATTSLLRKDAPSDDLWGGLSKSADELWTERRDTYLAEIKAKDSDNKTLFFNIERINKASEFESQSKRVWRVQKSKIFPKNKIEIDGKQFYDGYLLTQYGVSFDAKYDAFLLHSALVAKERGYTKFVFEPVLRAGAVLVHFVEPENIERYAEFSLDTETVIDALSPIIPPPEVVKVRKAQRKKNKKKKS